MTHFEFLSIEVEAGIEGKNSGIPMGFSRLNKYISIRQATYYLIGGYTGSGKTSILDDAFVLNPLDAMLANPKAYDLDLVIKYFSMERRKNFKLAKWICRKIFLGYGKIIPVTRMLGWVEKTDRLTKDEHDLFLLHEEYIDALMTKVEFIEGAQNPTAIRKFMDEYALQNGEIEQVDAYRKVYHPNNVNTIVEVISDHIGLTKGEKDYLKGKPAIDKSSSDKQVMRDLYGFSPIDVSQFNRDIANPMRIKNGDVEPMLEDFKETGSTQENADVVLSLFDPIRYKVADPSGYDLTRLQDTEGKKKYRSLKILKNSYGSDDIRIGLAMQPEIGLFKEMPKKKDITDYDYRNIQDNSFFLREIS